ncbi:MAG: circularly permuted type 2 ATP-grasp protein, partial [Rubrobacter sp.]|nr:circularly permuted type 2 ATP-grasp protein [Rubrobacter sp.]
MRFERELSSPNEVFTANGKPLSLYAPVLDEMGRMGVREWERRTGRAHERLLDTQRDLGITGGDKSHPTDYIPRLIPATDWAVIEKGLAQRMLAINEFLRQLEAGKQDIVPREVLESSALYEPDSPDRLGSVP